MYHEKFENRHIGIEKQDVDKMTERIGIRSLDELVEKVIPANIRLPQPLDLPPAMTERAYLEHMTQMASLNQNYTSYIGNGWYDTVSPSVIIRNVFENPAWYTSYTPYQAEISQGRLEALLNFQTMVCDLTAMELANSSLLDEATAAAEAAYMMLGLRSRAKEKNGACKLFADKNLFAQTLAVLQTRVSAQGIELIIGDWDTFRPDESYFGAIVQYPDARGSIYDYKQFAESLQAHDIKLAVAADLLSLSLLTPPGEWGADIVFGSTQRFGIPMGFGGPSAGYFATKESYKRQMPGRIVGLSKDRFGRPALRLALQTREQHIKRDKATSNICTAQALPASMAGFYGLYHAKEGLVAIASKIRQYACSLSQTLTKQGYEVTKEPIFDTIQIISLPCGVSREKIQKKMEEHRINLYYRCEGTISLSIDETTTKEDIELLADLFGQLSGQEAGSIIELKTVALPSALQRTSDFLTDPIFEKYRSETSMMRYIKQLERKDISLAHSMISLGSCTMKLNAASEMIPLSWSAFNNIHPMAPKEQTQGWIQIIKELSLYLGEITGLKGVSLQPNSGAAGEYTGLRVIKSYLQSKGETLRNLMLIPASAHGTNPASAIQAGFQVLETKCDANGNLDMDDFKAKAIEHKDILAGCMVTYPSTHGIFEVKIRELCELIHSLGGQVYMDGANMNAQVGLTHPGYIGADVCHLNLHKTFAGPHGGGGPGVGPICVADHLQPFLPGIPYGKESTNAVSAAPYGNALMTLVTYGYIRMLGAEGLTNSTIHAILNANYLAACLKDTYGIVYRGETGFVGHELILECRPLKEKAGITESDVAKRLMDFGFHAPTLSFPVHGTLMVEPTESESLSELDRFVETLLYVYQEIIDIQNGVMNKENNPLVNAPHPAYEMIGEWDHPYSRQQAAYPLPWVEENKFWINVSRVDNGFGDRNLVAYRGCSCD